MNIDSKDEIAGCPTLGVRRFLRETMHSHSWDKLWLQNTVALSSQRAKLVLEQLSRDGYVPVVTYLRVSTLQQGESGLGLAAQKDVVMRFVGNSELLAEFTEVESGKRHKNRPQLQAALDLCKKRKRSSLSQSLIA